MEEDEDNDLAVTLLREWKLASYIQSFVIDKGYEDVDEWIHLNVDRLIGLGFKQGHAEKFDRRMRKHFNIKNKSQLNDNLNRKNVENDLQEEQTIDDRDYKTPEEKEVQNDSKLRNKTPRDVSQQYLEDVIEQQLNQIQRKEQRLQQYQKEEEKLLKQLELKISIECPQSYKRMVSESLRPNKFKVNKKKGPCDVCNQVEPIQNDHILEIQLWSSTIFEILNEIKQINFLDILFLIDLISSEVNHQWLCQDHNLAKSDFFSSILRGNDNHKNGKPKKELIERVMNEMYEACKGKRICIEILSKMRRKIAPYFGFDKYFT